MAVHDRGELPDGRLWYTMTEVRGRGLDWHIGQAHAAGPPDAQGIRRLVEMVRRVAEAMAYAHSEGVIHRDLKPENIMIGRFGQVVNRLVQMAGVETTVLDHDLTTIQLMRRFGFKSFFGDPTRPELLHAAGLKTAQVLVVALDDKKAAVKLVRFARL